MEFEEISEAMGKIKTKVSSQIAVVSRRTGARRDKIREKLEKGAHPTPLAKYIAKLIDDAEQTAQAYVC